MCGIIGAYSQDEVSIELYIGLWALQHRGKESAGIATFLDDRGGTCCLEKAMGTVETVFGDHTLSRLRGKSGIGHVRYSTTGKSLAENAQPIEASFRGKPFFIAHNGNLVRYAVLRNTLAEQGYVFRTASDTEVIAALISVSQAEHFEDALREALTRVEGTYSLVLMHEGKVFGVRDSSGNRPLVIGEGHGTILFASESAACDVLELMTIRDVAPGEIVVIDPVYQNWYSLKPGAGTGKPCIFEAVYFLRPDSLFRGERAQLLRERMGRLLWNEAPVDADAVVPVPDSGNFAAAGLSKASGIPFEMALFRSHYVGRTFIEPIVKERRRRNRIKLNIIPEIVERKRIILVDDSIVRATVMRRVIRQLREARANEIHVRISSPMYRYPCFYGIDTYRVEGELIARRHNGDCELIRREIGADSLHYLSLEHLREAATGRIPSDFCDACFTGAYHIPIL